MMTKTFESEFHKRYVGGEGEVVEKQITTSEAMAIGMTYEEILAEYRWYVKDPTAQLPDEIMQQLARLGKISHG